MSLQQRLRAVATVTVLVALLVTLVGIRPAFALADQFSVNDLTQVEGNSGATTFTFTVTRTGSGPASVTYATSNGTAMAPSDYQAAAGTVSFSTGETAKTFTVTVNGDATDELDETFTVTLTPDAISTCAGNDCAGQAKILNDDGPSLVISNVTLTEGNIGESDAVFSVDLTGPSTHVITVDFATQDGTATVADGDYDAVNATLTFAAGSTHQSVTVKVSGDTKDESNETFAVLLGNDANGTIADAQGDGRIDNDDTAPTISIADLTAAETAGTAQVPLTLSAASGKTITVKYTTADDTAIAGTDYTSVTNGTVTFAPGAVAASAPVVIANDAANEPDETLTVTLAAPTNATIAAGAAAVTITDNDAAPTISIADATPVTEGDSATAPQTFTVTLSAASGRTITVHYATADGTALAGQDYSATSGDLTFAPGDTSKPVTVPIVGDTENEATSESYLVDLTAPSQATIADAQASGTINDNDAAPSLSIDDVTHAEGSTGTTAYDFTVTLSAPSGRQITIDYATADGTATAGSDYTGASGTLTFAPGETAKPVQVLVTGDTSHEATETFVVGLGAAANATISDASGTGTVTNDDAGPDITINDVTVTEGDSGTVTALFTVTLSTTSASTITVDYATADDTATQPEDYTTITGTLTFTPGDPLTQTVSVVVKGDILPETGEQYLVHLTNPTGGGQTTDADGVGTITNDDGTPPTLAIGDVAEDEGDAGTTTFTFTVTKVGTTTGTVTVDYATAPGTATSPGDFATASGTLTFAPAVTSQTITVNIVGDTTYEPNETFTVGLTNAHNASIADAAATGTITNDDSTPAISVADVALAEGDSGTTDFTFTITLSNPSSTEVTVDVASALGTTQAGDLTALPTTTLHIPAGQTSVTQALQVVGDITDEDNETFFVDLSNPVGSTMADNRAIGTITDDDAAPALAITSPTVAEGDSGATNVDFTISLSAASGKTVTVTATTVDGTAAAPADYTAKTQLLTLAPGETSKTFAVAANGDTTRESDETFTVALSGATNTSATGGAGTATLTNDDAIPTISVGDATISEGNAGTKSVSVTVTLSNPSSSAVTVDTATADGTATSGDYASLATTTVTFAAGESSKSVTIQITGDAFDEADETFVVNLANPSGATIADSQAKVTITDDDAAPALSINDVTVTEGNGGTTTATFTVTLSAASGRAVTVGYRTNNGTATADDYTSTSGTLTFAPGETSKTVRVGVKGDTVDEANESFAVLLVDPTNATVADPSGTGTIADDDTVVPPPANPDQGYSLVGEDGSLYAFGTAKNLGDMRGQKLNAPIIGVAYTPGGSGYWLVGRDGGIFTFGNADFHGSMGGQLLNAPVIGIAATPTGNGYWLFASDGGIFTFGDAQFFGSMGDKALNAAVINMEPVESGTGYWLVAADGGIFTFGTADFYGSMGDKKINQPVFDMTSTDTDHGYWLVARDGGIFSFGDAEAKFFGSAVSETPRPEKVIGMDSTPRSTGYWIADTTGKVYAYGDAQPLGDRYQAANPAPMIGFASVPGVKP